MYHNNYVMVGERERYFTRGIHLQKHYPLHLPGILAYIQTYDWRKHLEVKMVSDPVPVGGIEDEEKLMKEKESFMKKMIANIKRIFVKGR